MVMINSLLIKKVQEEKSQALQDIKSNNLFLTDLQNTEQIELEFWFKIYHKKIWFIS